MESEPAATEKHKEVSKPCDNDQDHYQEKGASAHDSSDLQSKPNEAKANHLQSEKKNECETAKPVCNSTQEKQGDEKSVPSPAIQEKKPEMKKPDSDSAHDKNHPKAKHTAVEPSDRDGHNPNAAHEKAGGEERKQESDQKVSAGPCAESKKTETQHAAENGKSKGTASSKEHALVRVD